MAATPIQAMIAHLDAFQTLDDATFASSLAFPFTHLYPDGDMNQWDSAADVSVDHDLAKFGLLRETYGRITLDSGNLIMDLPRMKVFHVVSTRYAPSSTTPTSRAQAVWAVHEQDGAWKLKARIGAGPLPLT